MWLKLCKRCTTVLLMVFQATVLDWYLFYYGRSLKWLLWGLGDVISISAFIASIIYADNHFRRCGEKVQQSQLPAQLETLLHVREDVHGSDSHQEKGGQTSSETSDLFEIKNVKENRSLKARRKNQEPETVPEIHEDMIDSNFYQEKIGLASMEASHFLWKQNGQINGSLKTKEQNRESVAVSEINQDPNSDYLNQQKIGLVLLEDPEFHDTENCKQNSASKKTNLRLMRFSNSARFGALPLAYVSWMIYSGILVAKMLVIFLSFADELDVKILFGSNMLELAFVLTAGVFAFVITSHKYVPRNQVNQRNVISAVQNQVLFDIVDSVEILDFFYTHEDRDPATRPKLGALRYAILILVAIQLMLPTVTLYLLSITNFKENSSKRICHLQQKLSVFLENFPFLIIRIFLWSRNLYEKSTFIFITKNMLVIIFVDWDLWKWIRNRFRRYRSAALLKRRTRAQMNLSQSIPE